MFQEGKTPPTSLCIEALINGYLPDDSQRDIRNEIKQKNPDFIDRHSCEMDGVELLSRQTKPPTMEPMHPVVSKLED